jgi:hypothetical protein
MNIHNRYARGVSFGEERKTHATQALDYPVGTLNCSFWDDEVTILVDC